jgi:hypothetical protein
MLQLRGRNSTAVPPTPIDIGGVDAPLAVKRELALLGNQTFKVRTNLGLQDLADPLKAAVFHCCVNGSQESVSFQSLLIEARMQLTDMETQSFKVNRSVVVFHLVGAQAVVPVHELDNGILAVSDRRVVL